MPSNHTPKLIPSIPIAFAIMYPPFSHSPNSLLQIGQPIHPITINVSHHLNTIGISPQKLNMPVNYNLLYAPLICLFHLFGFLFLLRLFRLAHVAHAKL